MARYLTSRLRANIAARSGHGVLLPIFLLLLLPGCEPKPEAEVEDRIEELVTALNAHDVAAASRLYKGGVIPPVDLVGDSSVVYRLLHIPGNEDLELVNVTTTMFEGLAQSQIELHGKVVRGDSVVGEMTLPLKIELQQEPDGKWLIVP